MSAHLQRATLLADQGRHEMAAGEYRKALAQDPDDPIAHSLLAQSLVHLEKKEDALHEAQEGVRLGPDIALTHYVLAVVFSRLDRGEESKLSAKEALRIDPTYTPSHVLLSALFIDRGLYKHALKSADAALAIEPLHLTAANFRAIALEKLGRKRAAQRQLDQALSQDPEQPFTHVNQGRSALESNDPSEAMIHFREALRLNPNSDSARLGIMEAMRSRNALYRWLLGYFAWSDKAGNFVHIATALLVMFALMLAAKEMGLTARFRIHWIVVVYYGYAYLTWIHRPAFNLLLRFDRFGRMVLSKSELAVTYVSCSLLLASGSFLAAYTATNFDVWLFAALYSSMMVAPIVWISGCPIAAFRNRMLVLSAALALLGAATIVALATAPNDLVSSNPDGDSAWANVLATCFQLGGVLVTFLGNSWFAKKEKSDRLKDAVARRRSMRNRIRQSGVTRSKEDCSQP